MKLNGIFGTGSGKVGASVWAVSSGVQIVRPYQPNVSNPNTDAQVAQRAKLKLMSQLAVDVAPVLAFVKKGLVSARNQFIQKNIGNATFEDGVASIPTETLQLTPGTAAIPAVQVQAGSENDLSVQLTASALNVADRVLYAYFVKGEDQQALLVSSQIVDDETANHNFPATFTKQTGDGFILAYGLKAKSASAKGEYDDYTLENSAANAELFTTRKLNLNDYTFTKTTGATVD